MKIATFETEEYFGKYEFAQPYLLSASDCESVDIETLIRLGGGSVEDFLRTQLGYPEMPGSANLRQEISSLYRSVTEDQILVLGSPIEGIYLTMRTLLEKSDHVVVLSPAYDALYNVAHHISGNVSRWFLINDGEKWSLDLARLEILLKQKAKLLVINFPHNPTGFYPSRVELDKILEIAARHGVRVLSDEMYKGLEYESERCLESVADLFDQSITLGGASKSLGLPGLRFGWLVVKDQTLYRELLNFKAYTSMCSTQSGEYLGLMAIRSYAKLVAKNLEIINKNMPIADDLFKRWQNRLTWLKPIAGTVSVVKVNEPSAELFCHELASRFGVILLPTKFMGCEDHFVRIGLGRANFGTCIVAFEKALNSVYSQDSLPPE
jgi:aspartate/methionine/tyrosine aminotransferase